MAKTYTAFTYDLTKSLKPIVDSCFEIPANLKVNIDITLDDEVYKQLASDPNWVQEVADTCHKAFTVTMDPMKAIFADEAKKLKIGGPKDQEAIDQITQRMAELLQGVADRLGTKAATSIVTMFDDYKKDKKALNKFRIKCVKKIGFGSITIGAAVAIAAASHAVLAPPAIVQIIRAGADIAHQCVKLATPAQAAAQMVYAEICVLDKLLVDGSKKVKAGMAITLEVASSLLGLPTPSLSLLVDHIKLHEVKITELKNQLHDLGKLIYSAMDRQDKYHEKLKSSGLSEEKIKTIELKLAVVNKALEKILEADIAVKKAVDHAYERHPKFVDAYHDLKKGVPGCVLYIKPLMDAGIDIVLSCSTATAAFDGIVGAVNSAESSIISATI